jgi:hypothetical protein
MSTAGLAEKHPFSNGQSGNQAEYSRINCNEESACMTPEALFAGMMSTLLLPHFKQEFERS